MELHIENLTKTYPNGVRALDAISLTIPKGMYGLLGPNGAGKSTLMRILATLQEPDSGSIRFGTIDVLRQKDEVRRRLGYLPQEFGVYPRVSAVDMLDHLALLKGVSQRQARRELVDAMLHRVNLYTHRRKAISSFSGGMKQRFGIAQALLANPQLVIVDEPTAGLDPGERNRFYNLLSEIGENVIVILSTHIVQDVKELCTQMAIVHEGRLLYAGSPQAAEEALQGRVWQKSIAKPDLDAHLARHQVISTKWVAGRPLIHVFSEVDPSDDFGPVDPDLEDVFFAHVHGVVLDASIPQRNARTLAG